MAITNEAIEQELLNTDQPKKESVFTKFLDKLKAMLKKDNSKKTNKPIDEKKEFRVALLVCIVLLIWAVVYWYITWSGISTKSSQVEELKETQIYNTSTIDAILRTSEINHTNLDWLLEVNNTIEWEIQDYNDYFSQLDAPYDNLMSNIYLPPINIWEDIYTSELDLSIIWQKFIEQNPYEDITLINTWTEFFKNVGSNTEFNSIDNIILGDLEELENGLFKIPLEIEFTSPSKRSFLLLINKLSKTSNLQNISLINEFVYFLWGTIKEEKVTQIEGLKTNPLYSWWDEDKIIWYTLYNWINEWEQTNLLDNNIIQTTIQKSALCNDTQTQDECLYAFRDKFMTLPTLAYTVWLNKNVDKVVHLRNFLNDVPVLISLTDFSFGVVEEKDDRVGWNTEYQGKITIDIYWKSMQQESLTRISNELWKWCIWEPLTPQSALDKINNEIDLLWKVNSSINTTKNQTLWELKWVIDSISNEYWTITNYRKAIRLFEINRMLKQESLCDI